MEEKRRQTFRRHLLKCGGSLRSWEIRHPVRSLETTGMCLQTNGENLGPGMAATRWGWKLGHHAVHGPPWHRTALWARLCSASAGN